MHGIEAGRFVMVTGMACALAACSFLRSEPVGVDAASLSLTNAASEAQTLTTARRLFEQDNPGLALTRVEAFLNANPDSPSGHNLAGAIFDRIGRYDLAASHYEKALALEGDYLPAINNFGLSKLQRAYAIGRPDLELEAQVLLARAVELSANHEQLTGTHNAVRATLLPKRLEQPVVATTPRALRTAWLERRGEKFTYVVTKPSLAIANAQALDLDPSLALVSPGATMASTSMSIVPSRSQRMRAWLAVPKAAPRLFGFTAGLSVLSLKPQPRWYSGIRAAIPTTLTARANALLKLAALP